MPQENNPQFEQDFETCAKDFIAEQDSKNWDSFNDEFIAIHINSKTFFRYLFAVHIPSKIFNL